MKNIIAFALFAACLLCLAGCAHKQLKIAATPANGSPGDLILIKVTNAAHSKEVKVTIGKETAAIVSSSDSVLLVMIPPIEPGATKLNVAMGKMQASVDFKIDAPTTVRLWFSMNGDAVAFEERQASNEEFAQNKSYGPSKLMYEIADDHGEILALGYLNDPAIMEAPTADQKSLSQVEMKGEVKFSINVPAFSNMQKIRISKINASTGYKPKLVAETTIK